MNPTRQSGADWRAVVFDAYGTLFDVHAAAAKFGAQIGPHWQSLSQTWRTKHLEYTWIHSAMGTPERFWTLAERSLDYAAEVHGTLTPDVRQGLLTAYRRMATYPEVPSVLGRLRALGKPLAILSNGDPDMLQEAVTHSGLQGAFDAVISVSDARIFKPHPQVYTLATNQLGVAASEIAFVSSNRWDVAGATNVGFQTFWLNRTNAPDEYPTRAPRAIIKSLDALIEMQEPHA